MLPLPPVQREAIAVGTLALSQRAADLRHHAATLTGDEHTAATREALIVETLVVALDAYVSAYITAADATADTERPAAPAPPPARDTERDAKFPSADLTVTSGGPGSPTRN